MDVGQFDRVMRRLAKTGSRRRVLGVLAVSLGLGGHAPSADSTARKKRRPLEVCFDGATISIRRKRKKEWLNKGATLGECAVVTPPDTDPPPFVCPAAEVCGAECCASDRCFAATVDGDTGTPLTFGCCPVASSCVSQVAGSRDQCCYPDEFCVPTLPNQGVSLGVCCRLCQGRCIQSNEECINGKIVEQSTARSPRYRR